MLLKTCIKDKFGRPFQSEVFPHVNVDPNHEVEALAAEKCQLESELAVVKNELASTIHEHNKCLSDLQATIKAEESDDLVACRATIEK